MNKKEVCQRDSSENISLRTYGGDSIDISEVINLRKSSIAEKIPDYLFFDLELYAKRNAFLVEMDYRSKKRVCLRCFKAYLLSKIEEFKLAGSTAEILVEHFRCETGHKSYFLDRNNLRKAPLKALFRGKNGI